MMLEEVKVSISFILAKDNQESMFSSLYQILRKALTGCRTFAAVGRVWTKAVLAFALCQAQDEENEGRICHGQTELSQYKNQISKVGSMQNGMRSGRDTTCINVKWVPTLGEVFCWALMNLMKKSEKLCILVFTLLWGIPAKLGLLNKSLI